MKAVSVTLSLLALSGGASADIVLHRETVIKVTMDKTVSLRGNHEGDAFSATVAEGPELPVGSRLYGTILEMHRSQGRRPAYMDLRFDHVRLPNGVAFGIQAVPVKMDYVRRDQDGHFRIDQPKVRKENYVLGGLLGGTLLGAILHKPFEGAFAGVLAGIIVAETSADASDEGALAHRGDVMGALIQEDVRFDDRAALRDDGGFVDDRRDDNRDGDDDPYGHRNAPWNQNDPNRGRDGDDPFGRDHRSTREGRYTIISVDDHPISFVKDSLPYWTEKKVLMVPLKRFASQASLDTDSANEGHVLYITSDELTARAEQGQRHFRLNGKRIDLPAAIEMRDGILYGPIDLFSELHLGSIRINGTKFEK